MAAPFRSAGLSALACLGGYCKNPMVELAGDSGHPDRLLDKTLRMAVGYSGNRVFPFWCAEAVIFFQELGVRS